MALAHTRPEALARSSIARSAAPIAKNPPVSTVHTLFICHRYLFTATSLLGRSIGGRDSNVDNTVGIVILAMIAAFLGLQLYRVLGHRAEHGEEPLPGRIEGKADVPPAPRPGAPAQADRAALPLPVPNLRPLVNGPFYAVKLVLSDLGTCGGLRADERARVLREDGSVIAGLYAVGNTAANAFGTSYPGAGATIAQGLVYGYIAAQDAAR